MPVTETSSAIFISKPNHDLLEAAKDILFKTQKVFTIGSSNRMQDLKQNPSLYYDLLDVRQQVLLDLSNPDLERLIPILSENQGVYFLNMLNGLLQAHKFGIGNCGEMASVGLHFSTSSAYENLQSVTIVKMTKVDHCFLRLNSKSGETLFIDPWFKNAQYNGVIFDQGSVSKYLTSLATLLKYTHMAEMVGPFYPVRYLSGAALAGAILYDPDKNFIIISAISSMTLCVIAIWILFANLKTMNCLNTILIERLTIVNDNDPRKLNFELFNQICDFNLDKIGKGAMLFSRGATTINEIDNSELKDIKTEAILPIANNKKESLKIA